MPIERDVVAVAGPEAIDLPAGPAQPGRRAPSAVGESAPSLLLQPTGKVDAWLRVTRTGDDDAGARRRAGHGDAVLARLQRFKLRTKAELPLDRVVGLGAPRPERRASRGHGAERAGAARRVARASQGVDLPRGRRRPSPAGLDELARAALEALRIECGVPGHGRRAHRGHHPGRGGSVAHRRVGELHQGLLHGPGAGRADRQPGRQRPAPDPRAAGRRGPGAGGRRGQLRRQGGRPRHLERAVRGPRGHRARLRSPARSRSALASSVDPGGSERSATVADCPCGEPTLVAFVEGAVLVPCTTTTTPSSP